MKFFTATGIDTRALPLVLPAPHCGAAVVPPYTVKITPAWLPVAAADRVAERPLTAIAVIVVPAGMSPADDEIAMPMFHPA